MLPIILNFFLKLPKIKGEFGDVYKGIIKHDEGKAMIVAVKTLKVKRHVCVQALLTLSK